MKIFSIMAFIKSLHFIGNEFTLSTDTIINEEYGNYFWFNANLTWRITLKVIVS